MNPIKDQNVKTISVQEMYLLLKRYLLLIVAAGLLGGVATYCACSFLVAPIYEASAKMIPGTPCDVVLNAYTDYLTKYGYIDYCPYGSLHSTGMLECEAPIFSVENKRVLREGMCICIDAYFKGMEWGSFRMEDCYLIGANGAQRMTTYNDKAIPEIFK